MCFRSSSSSAGQIVDRCWNHSQLLRGSKVQQDQPSKTVGKLVFLVPENADSIPTKFGISSPVDSPTLLEAVTHLAQKTFYFCDGLLEYEIVSTAEGRDVSSFCDCDGLLLHSFMN